SLDSIANSAVVTASDSTRSKAAVTTGGTGIQWPAYCSSAVRATLIAKDISSRKPITITMPSESRRTVRKVRMPLRVGLARTSQKWFSAPCICANTVVAPNSSVPTPTSVGSRPACSGRECLTASCTATAACSPISSLMPAAISPVAASSPYTAPTMATRMMTSGARENSVQKASAPACRKASRSSQMLTASSSRRRRSPRRIASFLLDGHRHAHRGGLGRDHAITAQHGHLREGSAEEQDQRGVVDPQQHQHQGSGRAIGGSRRHVRQVEGDQELAQHEQQRGVERAAAHVAPLQAHVRQHLEQQPQQHRGDEQRQRQ